VPEDAGDIVRVLAAVAAEGRWILAELPFDQSAREQKLSTALSEGSDTMWVLLRDGAVVGTLGLHGGQASGVAAVGMAICKDDRGRGGGRALLEAALEHAAGSELHKLELEVFTDNAAAIALYASHGFVVEGLKRQQYRRRDGGVRDALLMAVFLGQRRES
jgi:RimJ/RimL family protein N-acetyltransferase